MRSGRAAIWAVLVGVVAVAAAVYWLVSRPGTAPVGVLQTSDFHSLAFSPTDPGVVFFGHHNGVMRSDDGGRTWHPLVDKANFDAMSLAVNRSDRRQMFLAGHGIFQGSGDGGASWQPVANDLPGTDIHGFAQSPADPNRLYAFVVGAGYFQSADGGKHWQRLSGQGPMDVMSLAVSSTPETLYATSMSAGLVRSTDGGHGWTVVDSLRPHQVFAVAVDPASPGTVYAGTKDGLYKSTDRGDTWQQMPLPAGNVAVLAVSPSQPGRLLAISLQGRTGIVYRSDDGSNSWARPQ